MFLKRKFQNLFFLIFIIILFWFTPLCFVQAIIKIPRRKIPSFTINPESTNKLFPSAKLIFELDNIEEIEEGKIYYYKFIFKDDKLKAELKNENKELKDLSFVFHLDVGIFVDSDNVNLNDLFDIKCYQINKNKPNAPVQFENIEKSYEIDMYDVQSKPKTQKRKFSLIDLKEWESDIKIEIKTNSDNYEEYKELQDKKIKFKCELDITDRDNYPVYLFNHKDNLLKDELISRFDNFRNEKKSFQKMPKTNEDFYILDLGSDLDKDLDESTIFSIDYILNKDITPKVTSKQDNPIWLVFKQNDKFCIWDFILNKNVEYENKTYQELIDCYQSSFWISQNKMNSCHSSSSMVQDKNEKGFELKLKSLRLEAYKVTKEYQSVSLEEYKRTKEYQSLSLETYKRNKADQYSRLEVYKRNKAEQSSRLEVYKRNKAEQSSRLEVYKRNKAEQSSRLEAYQRSKAEQIFLENNKKKIKNSSKQIDILKKNIKQMETENKKLELDILQMETDNKNLELNIKQMETENKKLELDILQMEKEDENLKSKQQQIINNTFESKQMKEKYELCYKNYIEFKKNKENNIKQEFNNNHLIINNKNHVSTIKLYFLKKIYDNNIPDTYSDLHLKQDWDIDEIKYEDLEADTKFIQRILEEKKRKEKLKFFKIDEYSEQSKEKQKMKESSNKIANIGGQISDATHLELEKENQFIAGQDYKANRGKYKHLESIGNKDIKNSEDMRNTQRTERNNEKKIKITKITMLPISNSNFSLKRGVREYEPKVI